MARMDEAPTPDILYTETANASIVTPASGNQKLFVDTDHILKLKNSSGTVTSLATGFANPLTTTGDIIYSSSGTTAARLGIGSSAQVLTVAAGIPSWATPAGGTAAFVGAKAYNNTTQSIGTGGAKLAFNVEDFDTSAFHDTVTNNSRFTVPSGKAGYYLVTCFVWAASASATFDAPFYINGASATSNYRGAAVAGSGRTFSDVFLLSVADYVEVNLISDSTISYGHASIRAAQLQMSVALLGT